MPYYTGVGSRETPKDICEFMTELALCAKEDGYILRSGGAEGADTAFEDGAGKVSEIYRPTSKFIQGIYSSYQEKLWNQAHEIAAESHPAWHKCSDWARTMHTRNVFQVLGQDLDTRSLVLFCWTKDGVEHGDDTSVDSGGTGTAIRIASMYSIPVFNLKNKKTRDYVKLVYMTK